MPIAKAFKLKKSGKNNGKIEDQGPHESGIQAEQQ